MRIGFDVDGVLANFTTAYQNLHIQLHGDKFQGDRFPPLEPQSWNWVNEHYGYTEEETKEVWAAIKSDPEFWYRLEPLRDFADMQLWFERYGHNHDVYYITDRSGIRVKEQTENWLVRHGIQYPTVLISKHKGLAAKALSLDMYFDDRAENVTDVERDSPETKVYRLVREYNKHCTARNEIPITRIFEHLPR